MRFRALAGGLAWAVVAVGCGVIPEPEVGLACRIPEGRPEVVRAAPERPQYLGMTPQEAAALLETDDPGIEVTWRYSYSTEAGGGTTGYSECWCGPPPDGKVVSAQVTEYSQLMIMVEREQPIIGGRLQPRLGWGCEAGPDASPNA